MEPGSPSLKLLCPGCGATIQEILKEAPPYDLMADHGSETQGSVYQAIVCSKCDRRFQVHVRNTGSGLVAGLQDETTAVSVIDDPTTSPDDEWDTEAYQRENLPNDPGQIFKFATYDIDFIAGEVESGGHGSVAALNRMLLVQYFSAIEAYLSDRLIRLLLDNPKSLAALVIGNKEWAGEKISVVELASNAHAFRDWVHTRLRELMYHNFVKIDQYYRSALGSTIFPDEATKKVLMEFVPVRHDCVHRYGRDHDGRERTISKVDLDKLGSALENMVAHLEGLFVRRRTNG
ncbi:hypothetical protein HGP16_11335 [Rhizobium sp. P40RR-XXII]|uniref:hypothetical protein n=1 Tax=Rhizobium sp. P40RR-XXII TaxID=2726739 RepID=UPI001456647E|nr:hypothetical protein [Rhizobium sp. P40RR-XXII]NLS17150.1 hypothetical protein [Rhizobium sp. P40RR-XXII]